MTRSSKIPVYVLTGFLGSGKTTLLNAILKTETFANSAVIINEFGEIGLDHHLIETADDTIIELSNGCLCCTVRGKLIETLESLLDKKPERILIETTGLADPVPVLQALIGAPSLIDTITFCGLFTVFDAISGFHTLEHQREAKEQIALADTIIVSKLDLQENSEGLAVKMSDRLKAENPAAEIVTRDHFLSNLKFFFNREMSIPELPAQHHHHHDGINRHSERICVTILSANKPFEKHQIDMFLDLLLSAHGDHVLRIKGLVNCIGENRPMVVQGVGRILSEPVYLDHWPDQEPATNLVVFLDGLDETFVQRLFLGFINTPGIDTADKAALTENPLSIAGFNPAKN